MEKVKKLTFKALCQRKGEEFYLVNLKNPVKVNSIEKGEVTFEGKNHSNELKRHTVKVDEFLKMVNDRLEQDAKNRPAEPAEITAEMLSKGFKWREKLGGPEFEITKYSSESVTFGKVEDIADPVKSKEPDCFKTEKMADFVKYINKVTKDVYKEGLKAPSVKKAEDIKKTVTEKKSSESLSCVIPEKDRDVLARQAAELQRQVQDKEDEKKAFVSQIGGEIKELKAKLLNLTTKVLSGKEFRDVPIKIIYKWKENKKIVIRMDTNETLRESAIPVHELQNSFIEE